MHETTATLVVLFGVQVVSVYALPPFALPAMQEATGTLVVTEGAGQVVSV